MSLSNKNIMELVGWLVIEQNKIEKMEDDNINKSIVSELVDKTLAKIAYLNDTGDYDPRTGVHGMAALRSCFDEFIGQSKIIITGLNEKSPKEDLSKAFDALISDFEYLTTTGCIMIPSKIEEFLGNLSKLYRSVRIDENDIAYIDISYSKVVVGFNNILEQIQ